MVRVRVDEAAVVVVVLVSSWVHVVVGYGAAEMDGRKKRRVRKCMVCKMYLGKVY